MAGHFSGAVAKNEPHLRVEHDQRIGEALGQLAVFGLVFLQHRFQVSPARSEILLAAGAGKVDHTIADILQVLPQFLLALRSEAGKLSFEMIEK